MISWIENFQFNSLMGIGLYWVPLAVCVFGYTMRTAQNYLTDKKDRETEGKFYTPTDTLGTLIGRAIVSLLPVANLWAGAFDLAPDLLSGFFKRIEKIFNVPLVPDSASAKAKRGV